MLGNLVRFPSGSRILVLDSWPVLEWLRGRESAFTRMNGWMEAARVGRVDLVLSTINLGEVYYNCWHVWGEPEADRIRSRLLLLPVRLRHPTEEDVAAAARLRGRFRISYADAFTAVLAQEVNAPVVTGDPDFLKLLQAGICDLEWLGA